MFKTLLVVGIGGFIGTVLRYLVTRFFQLASFSAFPWGTFVVNITGSLLIGIIWGLSEKDNLLSTEWRLFLTVGICGGFTTFSTFSADTAILLQNKEWLNLVLYPSLSFFLGLAAVFMGRTMVKLI
jgi:fluoride exporter